MTSRRTTGFTLIELMLVVAIMGLMGSISVSGYRAMRRGMEQRSVLRNVSQFIRNAYQRSQIDRQPTAIFFWNEVRRDEDEDEADSMIVVGRAVAVRLAGRVSRVTGKALIDEFGDLSVYKATRYDENGNSEYDEDEAKDGVKAYIYRMSESGQSWDRCKFMAAQATVEVDGSATLKPLLTCGTATAKAQTKDNFHVYGYYLPDGTGGWKAGDTYGFEFADLTLPNNYIFGDTLNVKTIKDGPRDTGKSIWFFPPGANGGSGAATINISAVRPGKGGSLTAEALPDTTEDPRN